MLPLPRPIRCAAALRLCSCKRDVAELDPCADGRVEMVTSGTLDESDADGDRAYVVEVEVDVVGGAGTPVGFAGVIVDIPVEGLTFGGELMKLFALLVEPPPPPCR